MGKEIAKSTSRCFVSINIPEAISKEVLKVQSQLPKFIGKKTEQKNFHLTLKFLGEMTDDEIVYLSEILSEVKCGKLDLKLGDVGVFSRKFVRIVWMELKGAEKLQSIIDEKISRSFERFGREERFMGHLTIARVKKLLSSKDSFLDRLEKVDVPKISFDVSEFYLMSSELTDEGPKYKILKKINLG